MGLTPTQGLFGHAGNGMIIEKDFNGVVTLFKAQVPGQGLSQADNLNLDFGDLVSRPGWQGLLSSPSGDSIYLGSPYLNGSGETSIVCSSNSKLYQWNKSAPSALTELVNSSVSGNVD